MIADDNSRRFFQDVMGRIRAGAIAKAMPPGRSKNPAIQLGYQAMRLALIQKSRGLPMTALDPAIKAFRILKDIRVDRIACVDRPAQEHALVRLIKHAPAKEQTTMRNTDLDRLEAECDSLIKRLDDVLLTKRKQTFSLFHDDGYEDVSNPSMNGNANGNGSNNSDDGDGLDEEDDGEDIGKADASNTWLINQNAGDQERPGALDSSTHAPSRHKFEALADKIKNEEGLPPSESTRQARLRFPDVFASYQAHLSSTKVGKSAPADFSSLVAERMAKGHSRSVSMQQVMNAHGSAAFDTRRISKSDNAAAALDDAADTLWQRDESLSRCEAMRKARLSRPDLYRRIR